MAGLLKDVRWENVHGSVLLAGDCHSVPEMVRIARRLDDGVRATMLIEAFSRVQVYRVKVPAQVNVIWLVRDRETFDSSPCAVRSRGQRLATAIHAWCAEWACVSGVDGPDCTVWLAGRTPRHIVRMAQSMMDAMRADAHPRTDGVRRFRSAVGRVPGSEQQFG